LDDVSGTSAGARGGRRTGAGRPKVERKRKGRLICLHDEEWELIKEKAALQGMSPREYLFRLAESDPPFMNQW
jgi:hypothetical protein